jgi:hypothetical protein
MNLEGKLQDLVAWAIEEGHLDGAAGHRLMVVAAPLFAGHSELTALLADLFRQRHLTEEHIEIAAEAVARAYEEFAERYDRAAEEAAPRAAGRLRRKARNWRLQAEWVRYPAREPPLAEQVRLGILTAREAATRAAELEQENRDEDGIAWLTGVRRRPK